MMHKVLSDCYSVVAVKCHKFLPIVRHSCKYSTKVIDAKPFESIPGLTSLPLLGPLHHFLPVIGQLGPKATVFSINELLHKNYGPIVKIPGVFGKTPVVILFDPEDIDQVYRSQETNPLRPAFESIEYYREVLRKDTFDGVYGLMTSHGAKWHDFRKKVNPALMKIKLVKLYSSPLEKIADDFVKRLKVLKEDYVRDNFLVEIEKWSLESIAFVGLGARLGCFNNDLKPEHPANRLMDCAKNILQSSINADLIPIPYKYIETPGFKKLVKLLNQQWEISSMYIEQARKRINERGHDIPEEDKSIIEKLLAIDEKVAIMMANEMLLAGIDTVAFAGLNMLYHLAFNPDKQDILRQEINSGDHQKSYLKASLKEALRLWPVVPSGLRRTDKDHIVRGYHIPPGIDVVVPNQYLSGMEKYFPRPNEFLPERWLVDKADPMKR